MAVFNGLSFPDLPQLEHPYAHIQRIAYADGSFMAHLRCSDRPFLLKGGIWSFNGIVLPPLPELSEAQKAVYRYAYISDYSHENRGYKLTYISSPLRYSGGLSSVMSEDTGAQVIEYQCPDGTAWEYVGAQTSSGYWAIYASAGNDWTNTDIYDKDGNLYLAAGAPVLTAGSVVSETGAQVVVRTYSGGSSSYVWGWPYTMEDLNLSLAPDTVVWCNEDILDESGNVFLAASVPAPEATLTIPGFSLKSWLTGFAAGLAGGEPGAAGSPAATDEQSAAHTARTIHRTSLLLGRHAGRRTADRRIRR